MQSHFHTFKNLIKFNVFHFLHELLSGHFFNAVGFDRSLPCLKKKIGS